MTTIAPAISTTQVGTTITWISDKAATLGSQIVGRVFVVGSLITVSQELGGSRYCYWCNDGEEN